MKILFIHNKYGVTSGEEIMLQRIVTLLQNNGCEVRYFFKNSADITLDSKGKVTSFFSGIYCFKSRQEIRQLLETFKPDIVQVQNLFPLISPAILPVIKSFGVPIVMRLSNYRLVCPNGLMLSHHDLCEKCLGGKEYWCVLRNCEGSYFKSFGYALRNWVARTFRFYLDNVTAYYAQTAFQKMVLVREGFDADKISVIPNMIHGEDIVPDQVVGTYIGFAGRVSPEKGVDTLIAAAERCRKISFKFAGDYQRMDALVGASPGNIEFCGKLEKNDLLKFYRECRFLIMPSLWFEAFPGVIIEAMLQGKPVICSRIGGLPEIVEDGETGLLFEPGNAEDLAEKIQYLWERPDLCRELGVAGREKVLTEYSQEKYYSRLMKVYNDVILINRELTSSVQDD